MSDEVVSFQSAGLRLHGVVSVPPGVKPGERRAAFLVLHGFGSNSDSPNCITPARVLNEYGYVTLRFDMRGCGKSEGEFGRVICLEQVEDTGNALEFLAKHPSVDPDRIGVIGSSFGGAVGVYAGGTNRRVAAVISNGGWGDGERKFRGQHSTPEAWAKFTKMLEEGRAHRKRTGKSLDGAALRHRADPGPRQGKPRQAERRHAGAEFGRDVSGGDRAEHVRFPRR